jgi:D-serine deaminase-like pyridoxal phosphate-dependent protein
MRPSDARWGRYRTALGDEPLPAALVDLDAFEANAARLHAEVEAGGKTLRLATKSVRCVELVRRIIELGGGLVRGLMTYTAAETAFLGEQGFDDLLLAYPTVHPRDLVLLAETAASGRRVAAVVDSIEQVAALDRVAAAARGRVGVVIEIDMSYRPLGGVHLGVRRSPIRTATEVVDLARRILDHRGVELRGVMGYEAQIAGVTDASPFHPLMNAPVRAMKRKSRRAVERTRAEVARALRSAGIAFELFNGGGTGSLGWASHESPLTEVTAGSGYLGGHLFGYYRSLALEAAAYFALQVVRRPARGIVTCHGGGYVASGAAGRDRLPIPALPEGSSLIDVEGAGEVQTPVRLPPGLELALGDPVFFRHAKSGELAEHFREYLLVRGDRVEARAETYRGLGHTFLG